MRVRKIQRLGPIFLIRSQMKSKCRPTIAFALHSGEEAGRARTYCIRGHRTESASAATSTTAPPCHRTRVIISLSFGRSVGRSRVPFPACACGGERGVRGQTDGFQLSHPHTTTSTEVARRWRQRLIFQDAASSISRRHTRHHVGYWVGNLEGEAETLRHMHSHSLIASLPRFPLPWPCEQTRKKKETR